MDGVIPNGEVFVFSIFIVVMTDTEAICGGNFEIVHLFVEGFSRQVIHLMFVRRVRAPVAAGCESLADNQAPGRQFGLEIAAAWQQQ